jgi:hypothetical protein
MLIGGILGIARRQGKGARTGGRLRRRAVRTSCWRIVPSAATRIHQNWIEAIRCLITDELREHREAKIRSQVDAP